MIDSQALLESLDADATVDSFVRNEIEQPLLRLARSPDRDVSASATSQLTALADYRHRQAAETDQQLALVRVDQADQREKTATATVDRLESLLSRPDVQERLEAEQEEHEWAVAIRDDRIRVEKQQREEANSPRGINSAIMHDMADVMRGDPLTLAKYEAYADQVLYRQRLKEKRLSDRRRDEEWYDLVDLAGEIGVDNVVELMAAYA